MKGGRTTLELQPGANCWRRSRVEKCGFFLSGQSYFRAFRETVRHAEHEVRLLAWDISEAVEMIRTPEDDDGYPSQLADFLLAVLEEKENLVIRILLWDYSLIYLAEREWLPFTRWRNKRHSRLHLVTDNELPAGASHHQKVVIVDGSLAFCGGFDLGTWRWDTTAHQARDERRRTPQGDSYQPFHDVQMVLQGPVVRDLDDLFALRWRRATGEGLPEASRSGSQIPWPRGATAEFTDQDTALALTFSEFKEYKHQREIEQLHLDVIRSARRFLYLENQYFSSHRIADALCKRLEEAEGPELILVLTRRAGWAEEGTLGVLRDRLLEKLAEADKHGRFTCCYPHAEDEDGSESQVYVHAKLLIADDRVLVTGSANLSNRSMRVDSEVDLAFVQEEPQDHIRELREALLATHFQVSRETVAEAWERAPSFRNALTALEESGGNRLRPLEGGCSSDLQRKLADSQLLDPDEPLSPLHHLREVLDDEVSLGSQEKSLPSALQILRLAGWVAGSVALGWAIHRLWSAVLDKDGLQTFFDPLRASPWALPLLVLIFLAAGVLAVPINLLIIGATLTIGPWYAFAGGFTGCLGAAALSFHLGHRFGKPLARNLAGDRMQAIAETLANRGIWSVAAIRLLPIAPFGVLNLVAGLSGLRFAPFIIGSAIGLLPGFAAVILTTRQFMVAVENPEWDNWLVFLAIAGTVAGLVWWIRKRFT